MSSATRLRVSLLALRLGVFLVMILWTLDKFLNPDHTARVFAHFYRIEDLGGAAAWAVGAAQLVIVLAFVAGLWKRWSYGLVFVMHAVSTLSTYERLAAPYEGTNLLFYAAWPMLAACLALYLLRDSDTLGTLRVRG